MPICSMGNQVASIPRSLGPTKHGWLESIASSIVQLVLPNKTCDRNQFGGPKRCSFARIGSQVFQLPGGVSGLGRGSEAKTHDPWAGAEGWVGGGGVVVGWWWGGGGVVVGWWWGGGWGVCARSRKCASVHTQRMSAEVMGEDSISKNLFGVSSRVLQSCDVWCCIEVRPLRKITLNIASFRVSNRSANVQPSVTTQLAQRLSFWFPFKTHQKGLPP